MRPCCTVGGVGSSCGSAVLRQHTHTAHKKRRSRGREKSRKKDRNLPTSNINLEVNYLELRKIVEKERLALLSVGKHYSVLSDFNCADIVSRKAAGKLQDRGSSLYCCFRMQQCVTSILADTGHMGGKECKTLDMKCIGERTAVRQADRQTARGGASG